MLLLTEHCAFGQMDLRTGALLFGNSTSWLKRNNQYSRKFVLEDLEPVPARGEQQA